MNNKIKKTKGFTLLIAIVVTGMLLIISFVVANIAYKQLILANSNQESQYAFYNADSGVECAVYWDFRSGVSAFATSTTANILCNGQTINGMGGGGDFNATSTFTLDLPKGCAVVSVGKHTDGTTLVDSRGYNVCGGVFDRRVERGEKLSYYNSTFSSGGGGGPSGNFLVDTSNTLKNNLVSYWKLDENNGNRSDSYGGNQLVESGGVIGVPGKVNNASDFVFSSNQYLSIPSNSALSVGGTSFTVAAWVNVSAPAAGQQTFVGKRDTLLIREWILSYLDSTGAPFFRIFDTNGNTINTVTGPAISSNNWHFIVAWLDIVSSEIKIQVNNGLVVAVTVAAFPVNTLSSFGMGAMSMPTDPTGPNNFLNGGLDEVGFWKRVLTDQERTDLYNSGNGNTYNP